MDVVLVLMGLGLVGVALLPNPPRPFLGRIQWTYVNLFVTFVGLLTSLKGLGFI